MYSRHHLMPRRRGGLTGFGMHPSLGGLLIGGAYKKVSELTPEQHAERLRKAREYRIKRKDPEYVTKAVKPYKGPRKHLNDLRDAEYHAALLEEEEGHPDFAKWLGADYVYNTELYNTGKVPAWLRDKYTKKSGWFNDMQRAKRMLEGAPLWLYTSSSGKTQTVKEGSATFNKIMRMKRVQEHPELFQRVG